MTPARGPEAASAATNGRSEGVDGPKPAQTHSNAHVIWTAAETADFLRLRPSTVADMARRGDLPSIRIGRHRRYLKADVVRYVAALRRQSP